MIARQLGREVAILIVLKLAAITVIYFSFFSAAQRPDIDVGRVGDRILSEHMQQ